MTLAEDQAALVALAEGHVKHFLKDCGSFSMFAIARQPDGKDQYIQSSGEFSDFREEIAEVLRVLLTLARDGQIEASVICSPMAEGKEQFLIFDVESRSSGRCLVFQPYRKKLLGAWSLGDRQYKPDGLRVFAS